MQIYDIAQIRGWPKDLGCVSLVRDNFPIKDKAGIVLIMLGAIGDGVCLLSALSRFKKEFPNKKLTLIVESPLDLFMKCGFVDEVFCFDKEEDRKRIEATKSDKQLVLNLHSTYRSALLAFSLAGGSAYGLVSDGVSVWLRGTVWQIFFHMVFYPGFLDHRLEQINILGRAAILGLCLGVLVDGASALCCEDSGVDCGLPEKFIAMVTDANAPTRIWPIESFLKLAEIITRHLPKYKIVFLGRKKNALLDKAENSINLTGKTSIAEVCSIISKADFLISNDTGLVHIAGAYGCPALIICGPNNVGPEAKGHFLNIRKEVPCGPCRKSHCDSMICMKNLSPDDVWFSFRVLRQIIGGNSPGEFSAELSKRGLSAGYSFNREVDLFFDYHPLDMPYRKGAVFGDVLYRYLVVFIYCRESAVEINPLLLAGYMQDTFDLKQDEIGTRAKEISDFLSKIKSNVLPVLEKIDILIRKGGVYQKVEQALGRVLGHIPEELYFPLKPNGIVDFKHAFSLVVNRCDMMAQMLADIASLLKAE